MMMPPIYQQRVTSILVIILFLAADSTSLSAREWASNDGKFRVNADLIGFGDDSVKLATSNERDIEVPVVKLSADDREFLWSQVSNPKFAATVPKELIDFQKSMEEMRLLETQRIEERLKKLRRELRAGSRQMNHPIAKQAKALVQQLATRLTVLKSGKAYIPKLSPKDFRVGQIGTLDDDLLFGTAAGTDGDEQKISVSFVELRSTNDAPPPHPDLAAVGTH